MGSSPHTASVLALENQRGTVAITSVLLVIGLTGMAALTIDIGHALLTKNQLQNAADATALAAGSELGAIYFNLPRTEQQDLTRNITGNEEQSIQALATATASANGASNVTSLLLETAVLGVWSWPAGEQAGQFAPGPERPNAVQVTVSRNGQSNGPISTFFGGIFGVNTMDLSAVSTAALGVIGGNLPPGVAEPPFAISQKWPQQTGCGNFISFRPNEGLPSCAGWHNFENADTNTPAMTRTIQQLTSEEFESPEISPNDTQFNFNGGTMSPLYNDMEALFLDRRDPDTNVWDTTVPVYEDLSSGDQCDNPTGFTTIVGYANVRITNVSGPPDHSIDVQVQCDTFTTGKPSGPQPPFNGGNQTIPISPFAVIVQ